MEFNVTTGPVVTELLDGDVDAAAGFRADAAGAACGCGAGTVFCFTAYGAVFAAAFSGSAAGTAGKAILTPGEGDPEA
jgi:hypothetical protein